MPADESGAWALNDAPRIVASLNAGARDLGLSFVLDRAEPIDVQDERLARIPATQNEAQTVINQFAAMGKLSTGALNVVVLALNPNTFYQGWGNQDEPLNVPGSWPIILASTRVAKSRDPSYLAHELGHVIGFFDTTHYEPTPRQNEPYTHCGLSITMITEPNATASAGARQNVMSYEVKERRSLLSGNAGSAHQKIFDCWAKASGL